MSESEVPLTTAAPCSDLLWRNAGTAGVTAQAFRRGRVLGVLPRIHLATGAPPAPPINPSLSTKTFAWSSAYIPAYSLDIAVL